MTNGKRGPKKKYKYQVTVRLEDKEYKHLQERAAALNISAAEYLRQLIAGDMAKHTPPTE